MLRCNTGEVSTSYQTFVSTNSIGQRQVSSIDVNEHVAYKPVQSVYLPATCMPGLQLLGMGIPISESGRSRTTCLLYDQWHDLPEDTRLAFCLINSTTYFILLNRWVFPDYSLFQCTCGSTAAVLHFLITSDGFYSIAAWRVLAQTVWSLRLRAHTLHGISAALCGFHLGTTAHDCQFKHIGN